MMTWIPEEKRQRIAKLEAFDLFAKESTNINYNWLKQAENDRAKFEKEKIISWYEHCKPYLDRNFITEFPIQLHARWWELFLCNYLLERNFKLEENKAERADFCFTLPCGKRVEIEAVTFMPTQELMLCITSAIKSKHEQFKRYYEKDRQNNSIRIIAVNTLPDVQVIDFLFGDALLPFLKRVLLPIGNPQYSYDENDCQNGEWSYVDEPSVRKSNGAPVLKSFMNDMPIISGILFYHQKAGDLFNPEKMAFSPNPNASNPAPDDFPALLGIDVEQTF
jgi:hypothetical protein